MSLDGLRDASEPGSSASRGWYAVQVQPRRERLALLHLAGYGLVSFYPVRSKTRPIGRKWISTPASIFPGYQFVSLNLDGDRWRSISPKEESAAHDDR